VEAGDRPSASTSGWRLDRGWSLALVTVGVVVVVDQLTKAWVRASVDPHEKINVFFGIDITRVKNTGVAFGALSGSGAIVFVAVLVAMVGLLLYFAAHITSRGLWLPVGMVFGGAVGNLADRVRIDGVTDFIDPVLWPAFNVADMAIVVGVLGVLYLAETHR
jgi:signal peptidase II